MHALHRRYATVLGMETSPPHEPGHAQVHALLQQLKVDRTGVHLTHWGLTALGIPSLLAWALIRDTLDDTVLAAN